MKIAGTTGIVVCGGLSSRMKTDKGMLIYHGQPQYRHVAALLGLYCDNIYLSVNEEQQHTYQPGGFPLIIDLPDYKEKGPMAALLTAGQRLSGRHLLVLGCDYPLLDGEELEAFAQSITPSTFAKAFYNTATEMYEPLLAYYTANAVQEMTQQAEQLSYSLQRFLQHAKAAQYIPRNNDSICSVDDPEAAAAVLEKISGRKAPGHQ